jgi:hypothetical protein
MLLLVYSPITAFSIPVGWLYKLHNQK